MKKLLLILFILPILAFGQTRIYMPVTSGSDVTPQISTGYWTSTSANTVRQWVSPAQTGGSATYGPITLDATSASASTLFVQYVSPPMAAQTISGNIKGQFRGVLSAASVTIFTQVVVTVVDPAGNIVATLLGATPGNSTLTATSTNKMTPPSTALTPYTCNTGDRIVIEIGMVRSVGTNARTGSIVFGMSVTTDAPEDNTSTGSTFKGWMEFSNTLQFNHGITF